MLQGALVMANSGRLELGDNIYGRYTVTYLASKAIEFGEKRKIRAITPLKVIQGHRGRYQSKARMRLPISEGGPIETGPHEVVVTRER